MENIAPKSIRYIKLGAGGRWERALDRGRIEWSDDGDQHVRELRGDWAAVRDVYLAQGKHASTATGYTNEAKAFFDADPDVLWITFARGRMWWAFAEPEVMPTPKDDGAVGGLYRVARGGWSDLDASGAVLHLDRLSTRLTQLAGYRRTICNLSDEQTTMCMRYVNAATDPVQAAIAVACADLKANLKLLLQTLTWRDFEQFVDLAFARSGWIRVSSLGGATKDVDLIVEQAFTGERMAVQIKSKASQQVIDDYAKRLGERAEDERIMLICHSSEQGLKVPASPIERSLELMLDDEVADLAIKVGLVDWVMSRAL